MKQALRRAALALVSTVALAPAGAADHRREREAAPLLSPTRRSPAPPALEPPALPVGGDAIPATTFELATVRRAGEGPETHRTDSVVRTERRVSLVAMGGGEEWLFERNSVDPRRVAAYRVDHARGQILVYDESDLRVRLQLRGWTDVLTMRFPREVLGTLRGTGEREERAGATFERYVGREDGGIVEVWWSDTLLLPLRLTVYEAGARTTSLVEGLVSGVADSLLAERLADPRLRFPSYLVLDVADVDDQLH
jgi:hypothetical protein